MEVPQSEQKVRETPGFFEKLLGSPRVRRNFEVRYPTHLSHNTAADRTVASGPSSRAMRGQA